MKKTNIFSTLFCTLLFSIALMSMSTASYAQEKHIRKTKMFDISQFNNDLGWGNNWCAPTAVGNSLAWLASEYNMFEILEGVGTETPKSVTDVIDELGKKFMSTNASGTTGDNITKGKQDYIKHQGLENRITIETTFGVKEISKQWLIEQYDKGQDVEIGIGYYQLDGITGKWERTNGHILTYGDLPGESAGGHLLTFAGYSDTSGSNVDSDFQITVTDPGRDDLAGQRGVLSAEQYDLVDPWGNHYFNSASTYQVNYRPDFFGVGASALILDGYGGSINTIAVLEAGWAESPVPEANTFILMLMGSFMLIVLRNRRATIHTSY